MPPHSWNIYKRIYELQSNAYPTIYIGDGRIIYCGSLLCLDKHLTQIGNEFADSYELKYLLRGARNCGFVTDLTWYTQGMMSFIDYWGTGRFIAFGHHIGESLLTFDCLTGVSDEWEGAAVGFFCKDFRECNLEHASDALEADMMMDC